MKIRSLLRSTFLAAALVPVMLAAPLSAETLSNDDVIMLLEAGLGEEAVIAKIETSDGNYLTDTANLLALRQKGVPSTVIAAMVKRSVVPVEMSDSSADPMAPHFPGLYLFDEAAAQPRMWKIDPTSSTQTKTGGILGYALTGGIASASVKAVIPGDKAKIASRVSRPVFYVYFDNDAGNSSGMFSTGFGAAIQTPNEFSLVKLMEKKGKREARIGSMNIGGAKAGVMDKDQIAFDYEQIAPSVFKVTPLNDLEPGQYGFVFAVGGGVGPGLAGSAGTAGARVFAFGVE
ncbi:hypothetical protein U4960_14690 [Altererythrobacter sp. H2]|uniref:hypothetical protein n=1 Tax=Altererythrobacter sp. H2 TaxID=3108391 RepID=UPI002B4BD968|nr:hypothetical protein [Altererythrobacter sp. H2]WRK95510.1 hypothetical protein U4960_14690 [Altererythrobacter sp. H2]